MKTYEQHVKDLVLTLIKNAYKKSKTLTGFDSIFNFLSQESKQQLIDYIIPKLPDDRDEFRDYVLRRRRARRTDQSPLPELMSDIMSADLNHQEFFDEIVRVFETSSLFIEPNPEFSESLKKLQELFGLDEMHTKLLAALFIADQEDENLEDIFRRNRVKDIIIDNFEIFSRSKRDVSIALSHEGLFQRCGLLTDSRLDRADILSTSISDYLRGVGGDNFVDGFVTEFPNDILPLSYFKIDSPKLEVLKQLISARTPINILFEGAPGVGKTSMAYALLKELGLEPVYLKHDLDESDNRRLNLYTARRYAQQTRRVLIVDEADDILGQKKSFFYLKNKDEDKAWINYFLDSNETQIIWITNDTSQIVDSTCRRFHYILNFKPLTFSQRKIIWNNVIQKYQQQWIAELPEFPQIIKKYVIDAGSIDDAVYRTSSQQGDQKQFLLHYLDQKLEFLNGVKRQSEGLKASYEVTALNMSTSPNQILQALRKYLAQSRCQNLNLLFQGPSGTGKTEFVKYLAQVLEMELIIKTPADLSSKWVGEAEKNIARAFVEAESKEAILFLDEADAFFLAREGAHRSWEITQVNQMLIEMEKFKGILICSTNFMKNFDKAAMRRFQYKVDFHYLSDYGKERLFKSFFPHLNFELIAKDLFRLKNLGPGDFKNVDLKMSYLDSFSEQDVLKEFVHEVSYKQEKRTLGLN